MLVRSVHWALLISIAQLVTARNPHVSIPDCWSYGHAPPAEQSSSALPFSDVFNKTVAMISQQCSSSTKMSKLSIGLKSNSASEIWHADPRVRLSLPQIISKILGSVPEFSISKLESGTRRLLGRLPASGQEIGVSDLPSTTLIAQPKSEDNRNSRVESREEPALEQSHMTILRARQINNENATINATNDAGPLREISRTSTNPLRDAFNPFVGNIGPFLDSATDITVNKRPEKKIYGTIEIFFISHHLHL